MINHNGDKIMKKIESQLKTILSGNSKRGRNSKYPDSAKELCIKLAKSDGVLRASIVSGISKTTIYDWVNKSPDSLERSVPIICKESLILQEIDSSFTVQKPSEIKLVSSNGTTAHFPAISSG
jgi:hypothetical protein